MSTIDLFLWDCGIEEDYNFSNEYQSVIRKGYLDAIPSRRASISK